MWIYYKSYSFNPSREVIATNIKFRVLHFIVCSEAHIRTYPMPEWPWHWNHLCDFHFRWDFGRERTFEHRREDVIIIDCDSFSLDLNLEVYAIASWNLPHWSPFYCVHSYSMSCKFATVRTQGISAQHVKLNFIVARPWFLISMNNTSYKFTFSATCLRLAIFMTI